VTFRIKRPQPNGDLLLLDPVVWIKKKFSGEGQPYYSTLYHFYAEDLSSYYQEVSKRETAVDRIRYGAASTVKPQKLSLLEAVQIIFVAKYGMAPGIVIFNASLDHLSRLAEQIPALSAQDLSEDFLLFPTPSRDAARKAVRKVPASFADAVAIDGGRLIEANADFAAIPD
jgi:hypothetical protein